MSDRLFVYGTLLFEPVWLHLINRAPLLQKGTIYGWSRRSIKGVSYPAICREEGSCVVGALVSELSEEEWQLVEEYEDVGYVKARVEVVLEQSSQYALTYARPDDSCADLLGEWTTEDYLASGALLRFI